MSGPILSPAFPPLEVPPMQMEFNDREFVIVNISSDEQTEINLLNTKMTMRPVPPKRKDMPTSVIYTAQNLCEKAEFEAFYLKHLGKSVKMFFEERVYYGYLTDLTIGEYDVTFKFSYTSNIPSIPEDPGWYTL